MNELIIELRMDEWVDGWLGWIKERVDETEWMNLWIME